MTIRWGCNLPQLQSTTSTHGLAVAQADAGQHIDIVGIYQNWIDHTSTGYNAFPVDAADFIYRNGSTPTICWQAENAGQPLTTNPLTAASVLNGTHDAYITAWAQAAKNWGHLLYVRVLHEFDGNWYVWSIGNNGYTPANLIAVWQRIVGIFRTVGASNVKFVWCPSRITTANQGNILASYPGDAWVDWLGCDGYNFGSYIGHSWQTVEQVFDLTLLPSTGGFAALSTVKPVMVCEVGCAEDPASGDKGAWITHLLGYALKSRYPSVGAFVWMQDLHTDGLDNTFESSPGALAAFRGGVALAAYRPSYLTVTVTDAESASSAAYLPLPTGQV